mmetsp:Transcript_28075/g.81163  ORF Transcript_28075/g.81163 Transcript_28075/m.81163 type:complete len:291 (+) Transcript_28075:325-1197(+)
MSTAADLGHLPHEGHRAPPPAGLDLASIPDRNALDGLGAVLLGHRAGRRGDSSSRSRGRGRTPTAAVDLVLLLHPLHLAAGIHLVPLRQGIAQLDLAGDVHQLPVLPGVLGQVEGRVGLLLPPPPVPQRPPPPVVLLVGHPVLLHEGRVLVPPPAAAGMRIDVDAVDGRAVGRAVVAQHPPVVGFGRHIVQDSAVDGVAAEEEQALELRRRPRLLVDALPEGAEGVVQIEADLGVALPQVGMGQVEEDGVGGQAVVLGGVGGLDVRLQGAEVFVGDAHCVVRGGICSDAY